MSISRLDRERWKFLGDQLRKGIPLEEQQRLLLAKVLTAVGNGVDPSEVFGDVKQVGKSKTVADKQEKIGTILQQIAFDLLLAKRDGRKLLLSESIRNHVHLANRIMGYRLDKGLVIDEHQIRRWWDNKAYRHLRNPIPDHI